MAKRSLVALAATAALVLGIGYARAEETNVAVTVTNDMTLTWNWATQHMFKVESAIGGTTTGTADDWYDKGTMVNQQANENTHYSFVEWEGVPSGKENDNPVSFALEQAYTNVTPVFALDQHLLTVNSAHGVPNPGTTNVAYGTVVTQAIEKIVGGAAGTRYRVIDHTLE